MDKLKIGLRDKEFEHIVPASFCGYDPPSFFEWDKETPEKNKIVVFSERCLEEVREQKYIDCIKVCFLNEPFVIHDYGYKKIEAGMYKDFDYVLTHNMDLLSKIDNGVWYPNGASWFYRNRWKIYDKSKNVSIIASDKKFAPGHKFRHEVIAALKDKIDFICGKGYLPVDDKMVAFQDYRFQIVIENCICPDYWTDKLIDCFATGTIPIMWGGEFLKKYFDMNGIILFDSIFQLRNILNGIDENFYKSKIKYINNNFETAKQYCVLEDWLYNNFFKNLL